MMLLRGSRHSRLVTTISGGHTLVHRLVQRQFSSAPVCKSNAPGVDDKTYVEILKAQIKFVNGHPDLTAEEKYRNSKRIFAILDTRTSRDERLFLLDKRKPILRVLKQPDITQRRKKDLPDPELTRAANYLREVRIAYEKESAANWHAFKLIMFAHRDDVPIWPRILHIPRYIRQEGRRRFVLFALRLWLMKSARWLS